MHVSAIASLSLLATSAQAVITKISVPELINNNGDFTVQLTNSIGQGQPVNVAMAFGHGSRDAPMPYIGSVFDSVYLQGETAPKQFAVLSTNETS